VAVSANIGTNRNKVPLCRNRIGRFPFPPQTYKDRPMGYFYEIRSADNAALKRDGGFATQDAGKIAGREDAKKMKNSR
jgi:hypothetical protein